MHNNFDPNPGLPVDMSKRERLVVPLVSMTNPLSYGGLSSQGVANGSSSVKGVMETSRVPKISINLYPLNSDNLGVCLSLHISIELPNHVEVARKDLFKEKG